MLTVPGSTDEILTDETLTDEILTNEILPAEILTDETLTDEMLTDGARTHEARTDGAPGVGNDLPLGEAVLPCWSAEPDLWFAESPADVEAAKALCVPCPLREACLAGALERREPWGVWGGQLLVAGVVVARKRPRGRPRKTDLAA